MANDRIWIECDECHEKTLLFKYYPREQGYVWDAQATEDFLNSHLTNCRGSPMFLKGKTGLSLKSEDDYVEGKGEA